jgi:aminomethyltransferase
MKKTPLSNLHRDLGAKMADFAGFDMPIVYSTIKEEHQAVRNQAGIFDVSHMGEFIVKGKEALDLIQKVTSNNAATLEVGQAQYSCLPNQKGGIVDDLLVYRLDEDQCSEGERAYMLVVNAGNIEKDWHWISQQNYFETRLVDISDDTGLIALQGPNAVGILQKITETDLNQISFYHHTKGIIGNVDNVIISATGYTGSGGFELYFQKNSAVAIWEAIMDAGKPFGLIPAGLGARDTLRLEKGYCLYGNDINDETSPLEAGLGWITKTNKGLFNSRDIFIKQKSEGLNKRLVGFKVDDRRVARQGYEIADVAGNLIGKVTSGTLSPSLGIPIGLGYVTLANKAPGTQIKILTGRKELKAEVVKLPFL